MDVFCIPVAPSGACGSDGFRSEKARADDLAAETVGRAFRRGVRVFLVHEEQRVTEDDARVT